jgi:hypothetical protein
LENLIPFIKKKCDFKDIEIELIDINGHVKDINQNLSVYAQKLFKHREVLFLFKVDSKFLNEIKFDLDYLINFKDQI